MSGHADRAHRRFSPSQAERFFLCKGSTRLLAGVAARPSSPYAIEGTKAHEVLEAALANGIRDAETAHREYSSLCMEDLNTIENMFYFSINATLNHVYAILDEYPDAVMYLETYVDPPVANAPGEAAGYCDIAIYVPSTRTLFVIDYKHGAGVAKDVIGNNQAYQYAGGFIYDPNSPIAGCDIDTVVLTIAQPRAFHADGSIREIEVTPYEVFEYLSDLDEAIAANLDPNAELTPGDDQCRFCDANAECPAREAKALATVSSQFRQIGQISAPAIPDAQSLDIDRLAYARANLKLLRKWCDDVEQRCYELAREGHHIPGAKLVEAAPKREWYGEPEEVARKAAALSGLPVEKFLVTKTLALTHAEKLVVDAFKQRAGRGKKNKAAEDARNAFAFLTLKKSSGSLSLVDDSDERPAVTRAVDSFQNVTALIAPPTIQET